MIAGSIREYSPPSVFPYTWSSAWGEDEYGLWTEFEYRDVVQRMRWIPPGSFMMGSPNNEVARFGDELHHEVEITRGFWLADTACSQALWEAVMGENPSGFKGGDRPVETVSWEDCRVFIDRINQEIPTLNLCLPTEAQWEYACRAGTTTPFWFGNTINPDQVNYDGNHPYAGGEPGINRNETVPVKALPPNGWGLYQMHGNVWEWCADWYGPYEVGQVMDPQGPTEGEDRVLRGGSWVGSAGLCRSASRYCFHPGVRDDGFGFRLSRGQENR